MNREQIKERCGQSKFWPHFYPRIYKNADRFGDPRTAAYALTIEAEAVESGLMGHDHAVIAMTKLALLKMPAMFVAREFAAVAAMSSPPPDLEWANMKLPFEAGLLMLPHNWLIHPKYGECEFLGWARYLEDGVDMPNGEIITFEGPAFNIFTAFSTEAGFPVAQTSFTTETNPTLGSLTYTHEDRFFVDDPQEVFGIYATSDDLDFMERATSITFSILMAITARPMLREHGRNQGSHKKSGLPIWTPNIVGRDYRIRTEPGETGSGSQKRLHWRRGHFRQQPIGSREKPEHKIIWIEPTLIGGNNA